MDDPWPLVCALLAAGCLRVHPTLAVTLAAGCVVALLALPPPPRRDARGRGRDEGRAAAAPPLAASARAAAPLAPAAALAPAAGAGATRPNPAFRGAPAKKRAEEGLVAEGVPSTAGAIDELHARGPRSRASHAALLRAVAEDLRRASRHQNA